MIKNFRKSQKYHSGSEQANYQLILTWSFKDFEIADSVKMLKPNPVGAACLQISCKSYMYVLYGGHDCTCCGFMDYVQVHFGTIHAFTMNTLQMGLWVLAVVWRAKLLETLVVTRRPLFSLVLKKNVFWTY